MTELRRFYNAGRRDMPWRTPALTPDKDGSLDPYAILVSELMLQQTQVSRVIPKYLSFMSKFLSVDALAAAPLSEVLAEWVGLGYNRRARYLHEAARTLAQKSGKWTYDDLVACKGIGPNTAAAIVAYAYDQPALFIETNIRTVLIHHFCTDKNGVSDKELLDILAEVVPWQQGAGRGPREFYWAMMDYGTHLKARVGNLNTRSKTYARQSKFEGSQRQIRGRVIRLLAEGPKTSDELRAAINDERLPAVVTSLAREHLVRFQDKLLMLYNEK